MTSLIAYCETCGGPFQSSLAEVKKATDLTVTGNLETCPRCGELAPVLDGVFNVTHGVLEIVRAPGLTRDLYQRFGKLIGEAAKTDMAADELNKRAGEIHPQLEQATKQLPAKSPWRIIVLMLLIAALESCDFNFNVNIDINELYDQVVETVMPDGTAEITKPPEPD